MGLPFDGDVPVTSHGKHTRAAFAHPPMRVGVCPRKRRAEHPESASRSPCTMPRVGRAGGGNGVAPVVAGGARWRYWSSSGPGR